MAIAENTEQLLFGLGLAAAIIAAVAIAFVVLTLAPTLAEFGFELPNLTRWIVAWWWSFLLLPLAVILAWHCWPVRTMRAVAALAIGVGSLAVFVPLTVFAMYYPVLVLGDAVS